MRLDDDIRNIKNVGDKRKAVLNKLGINTVRDMLTYYPYKYDDRSEIRDVCNVIDGENNSVLLTVRSKPDVIKIKGLTITKLNCYDRTGKIQLVWYNQPYIKNTLDAYENYIFYGKVVEKKGLMVMEAPEFEKYNSALLSSARIVPIYRLTKGLTQKNIRQYVKYCLDNVNEKITEYMPSSILQKYNLIDINNAVRQIHFPDNEEEFVEARKRLVFDELFFVQLNMLKIKGIAKVKTNTKMDIVDTTSVMEKLPFNLTSAQDRVIGQVIDDMQSEFAMNRLVQGDVGSGKTVIALISSYVAIKNGYQAVIMAPTEVLARQHFLSLEPFFLEFGISVVFLAGSLTKKQKDEAHKIIENGECDLVIGTHAIIQDKVKFHKLGLTVTDEQHRFGVAQRNTIMKKGDNPHVLIMTATPIPRTLGLILYGDLDVSVIDELPPSRQKIDTFRVDSTYYKRLYGFIQKLVAEGQQVYVICPLIEENETMELNAVKQYTEKLQKELVGITVECLYGSMKQKEKDDIMERFAKNEIQVLVSTTVIEVGINVPNATLMIIENAERFGLSQLHQLRGRVGRGSAKSYCVLVSDSKSDVTKKRLKVMCDTNDGFVISEKDLEQRGYGDFFGTRQHGLPEFKIANLYKDINMLEEINNLSKEIYENIYVGTNIKDITEEELDTIKEYLEDNLNKFYETVTL